VAKNGNAASVSSNYGRWRESLPELRGQSIVLREVRAADAAALFSVFSDPEVQRFLPTGPRTIEQFRRFIGWVRRQRRAGRYLCFVLLDGQGRPSGLFQIWPVEPGFATAEFGFAVARPLWRTGAFTEAAQLVIQFAFETLRVRRLECRAAAENHGALRALNRLGASREGTLREAFATPHGLADYVMCSILAREWQEARACTE
jgi:RimJ/RimL family protein N-acetyltransferase